MPRLSTALLAGVLTLGFGNASALDVIYNDSLSAGFTAFESAVNSSGGTLTSDTLTGLSTANSWARTGYTISSTDGSTRSIISSYYNMSGNSITINPYNPAANSGLTFTFDDPINAFGLEVGDWATCCFPSSLYISFDGGATQLVATANTDTDNPGYVADSVYTNFVGAVDDTASFTTVTFYGDGFGEALYAGGTIHFASVPIGSFSGGFNFQPITHAGIAGVKLNAGNLFHRLSGRTHGLDEQFSSFNGFSQSPFEALDVFTQATAGQDGFAKHLYDASSSFMNYSQFNQQAIQPLYANANNGGNTDLFRYGPMRGFVNARYEIGDHDAVGATEGYDFKGYNLTFGIDRDIGKNSIVGVAFGYGQQDSETDSKSIKDDVETYQLSLFGSWAPRPDTYVEGVLTYGRSNHDVTRDTGLNTVTASPDSEEILAALHVGRLFEHGNTIYGPFGGIQYARTKVDGYEESGVGGLEVGSQTGKSVTAHVGIQASTTIEKPGVTLVPQIRFSIEHEFEDNNRSVLSGPIGGTLSPVTVLGEDDGTYGRLTLGLAANSKDGDSSFRVDYEGVVFRNNIDDHAITLRYRTAF
jgi:subtilase-type serine protease